MGNAAQALPVAAIHCQGLGPGDVRRKKSFCSSPGIFELAHGEALHKAQVRPGEVGSHKLRPFDVRCDHNAASHLEQALSIYAAKKPGDVGMLLFGIGGAYEILGDLSQKDKCRFYGKARSAFDEQLPLIKGDSYTAYGKTVALEPLRADIRKHLTSVDDKSAKAGCSIR